MAWICPVGTTHVQVAYISIRSDSDPEIYSTFPRDAAHLYFHTSVFTHIYSEPVRFHSEKYTLLYSITNSFSTQMCLTDIYTCTFKSQTIYNLFLRCSRTACFICKDSLLFNFLQLFATATYWSLNRLTLFSLTLLIYTSTATSEWPTQHVNAKYCELCNSSH